MTDPSSSSLLPLYAQVAARLRRFGTVGLFLAWVAFSGLQLRQFWLEQQVAMQSREHELRTRLQEVLIPAERSLAQTAARGRDMRRALEEFVKADSNRLWAEFRTREGKSGRESIRAYRLGREVKTRGWGPATRRRIIRRKEDVEVSEEARQIAYRGLEWKGNALEVRAAIEHVHYGLIRDGEWVFKVRMEGMLREYPFFEELLLLPNGEGVLLSGKSLPVKRSGPEVFESLRNTSVLTGDLTYGLLIRWEAVIWEGLLAILPPTLVFIGLFGVLWLASFPLAKRFGVGMHREEDLVLSPEEQEALGLLLQQSGSEIVALAHAHEKVAYSVTDLFRIMGPNTGVVSSEHTPQETFAELRAGLQDLRSLSKPWEALSHLAKEWKGAAMTATPEQLQTWATQMETLAVRADSLTKEAQARVERGFAELEGFFEAGVVSGAAGGNASHTQLRPIVTESQKLLKLAQDSHRRLSSTHRTLQDRLLTKRKARGVMKLEDRSSKRSAA